MAVVLRARGLTVARGRRIVLADVTFTITSGTTTQLVGPNGSGKTSLLRVLAGLTHPRGGILERDGPCAFVPEKVTLTPALRCREWLGAMRGLRGLAPHDWAGVLVASGLEAAVLDRPAAVLSKGMTQRLALLEAMQSGCSLLLLDEPFSGLDADGRGWLAGQIAGRLAPDAAVVFTDHSGAAGGAPAGAAVLTLRDGTCAPGVPSPEAGSPRLRLAVVHPDGRRRERVVPESELVDLLGELLADGWHVTEVRR